MKNQEHPKHQKHRCSCQEEPADDVINRLADYEERMTGVSRRDREELIPALALRSYHLPGYSYCDDWMQYFQNNHPVVGMCCHHPLHPIGVTMRLLHFLGSIMFGLTVTNLMWLWFFYRRGEEDEPSVTISLRGFGSNNSTYVESNTSEIEITQGMLMLWTVGGGLHACFDNTVWYLSACICCLGSRKIRKYRCCATYIVAFIVLTFTAIATLAVLVRTSIEEYEKESAFAMSGVEEEEAENVMYLRIHEASAYEFLLSYATELVLALFVYYPVVATILFSGYLGCGNLPILGGRPYEVKLEQRKRANDCL